MPDREKDIAARAREMPPFIVMDILEKAKEMEARGENIIHLEIGEPDFDTPEPIKEAARRALRDGDTHYTHSLGKPKLREEIARYYLRKYGVSISPDQIIVTSGTSPAMLLTFGVLLEQGDEVILPDPHYACYPNFIRYHGGRPVFVPVKEEDGFKYRLPAVQASLGPRTRAIMVNSPANPTGAVFTAAELEALAGLEPYIIADEIYHGLVYEGREHTILEFTDRAFVINGFSKLYAMTGWRLGYVIAPPELVRPLQKLQQNLFICAGSFVQAAGIAALRECDEHVAHMVATYDERRRYLLSRLKTMGLATRVEPTGAFYALANVKKYTGDSYSFAFEILEKARVAVTPGIDFGRNCEGYLRISYANSLENIKEGLDRLVRFLAGKKPHEGL
ncbi:Pyridoxal phosphate-dependent transferase [Moorella glycerini]|uniref:Aminotransferase n=1 Tax=Neomoorella stamsii TaxID=1266720 RepID=A0A9X7J2T8_9FIRM|nr:MULTISPECIES: pyridoxal phosphate-dependent aminotransferase [Moorella]PRR72616.1 Aspartate aminotransferase [Moorella stamsii]CEP67772.1 Pyridoxal phosphate-dependent transferase [Moorella glycerini]